MLTRFDFDQACKAYVDAHHNHRASGMKDYPAGWIWTEHPYVPNLGYLSRTVHFPRTSNQRIDAVEDVDTSQPSVENDDAVCHVPGESLTCNQYVVYSATFGVPAFYFTLHDNSGSPLALEDIIQSALFRPNTLPSPDGNTFAVALPDSTFSLMSQGDHPTLGTPSWYFHPCNTAEAVGEIMAEIAEGRRDGLRWLEAWFMVTGNTVNFFAGV
ncbi:hypothetical protein L226DRAFT_535329 [Lentinus tigrinus ALCF2SS1-7]|uniref:uncharacterized protein n=1 Tax=Lentinus tigrinus ALCF2SS1-7 TaxID=1328758 RepID=UPI001165CD26|nr:hypothetical protein L226DRAFT_535329 [Lentinus tigrinus ALCF2SS1-7]